MKEALLSNSERKFVWEAIRKDHRLDGRRSNEFRKLDIQFGLDTGCALVSLANTKVMGQVSCELGEPKATRPTEGLIYINVEIGPMAAAHFEAGRNTELTVQVNRTLERTFKDSRCVDLESLCIIAEECVWVLRVDLNVLNYDGNIIDCCSIATLAALAHFKRPDVSIVDGEVVVHTAAEKEPIPIVLHHSPVCITYCTYDEGQIAIVDPLAIEERICESQLIFGLNSYRELCCLNLGGSSLTSPNLLLQSARRAADHVKYIVDTVKRVIEQDVAKREAGEAHGFAEYVRTLKNTGGIEDQLCLKLRNFCFREAVRGEDEDTRTRREALFGNTQSADDEDHFITLNNQEMKWIPDDDGDEEGANSNVVNMDSDSSDSLERNVDAALSYIREATKSAKE